MRLRDYLTRVAPRAPIYALNRRGRGPRVNPLTLTFSVTAACQSRCKTCGIGRVYLASPEIARRNLSLDEIEQVFRSLGPVYFFNVSGGEPFMRADLAEIVRLACIHLKPRLIHIPTNALAPRFIDRTTRAILGHMRAHLPASVPLTVKPSIDGVGAEHDYVRGMAGNFARLEQTLDALLAIRAEDPRLHVDLGTVISNLNIEHLDEIEDWVHRRGVESYRHEIAEQRAEFHNLGDPITPSVETYALLSERFKAKIFEHIAGKATLTRVTEAVRVVYYDLAVRILRERRQVTPCYGGLSNIHLNHDGTVWPCCVLGDGKALGSVREWEYDIQALLRSDPARAALGYIAEGRCACPLANQWLNNVLLTPRHMLSVLRVLLVEFRRGRARAPALPAPDPAELAARRLDKVLALTELGTIPDERAVSSAEYEAWLGSMAGPPRPDGEGR